MADLIDRQAAIDAVNSLTYPSSLVDVKHKLIDLPPAEPQRKKGRWIEKAEKQTPHDTIWWSECSVCGHHALYRFAKHWNFCPNCSADMRMETVNYGSTKP